MKTTIIFITSFLLGAGALWFVTSTQNFSQRLDDVSQKTLVDTSIDAIDAIGSGDVATAELLLASAVNSQIVILKKNKTSSEDAIEWEKRMKSHNARLGLRVTFP